MMKKQNCVICIQTYCIQTYVYRYICFIVYIKTDDIYKDIAQDVKTRFDTSNYELKRPLPKGKNKKSNWINKR